MSAKGAKTYKNSVKYQLGKDMEKFYTNQAKFDEVKLWKDLSYEDLTTEFDKLASESHEWYTNSENKQSLLFFVYPETLWYQGELDEGEQDVDSDLDCSDSDASDREEFQPVADNKGFLGYVTKKQN